MTKRSGVVMPMMLAISAAWTAGERLASVDGIGVDEVVSRAFTTTAEQEVRIEGVVVAASHDDPYGDVWLLDSGTREAVWRLDDGARTRERRGLLTFEDTVKVPAGGYELYVSTFRRRDGWAESPFDLPRFLDGLFRRIDDDVEDLVERVEVTVEGSGTALGDNTPERVRERLGAGALVAFTGVGDDASLRRGFELKSAADIEVYAVGELSRDGTYDSGWIADAVMGEKVWRLDHRGSRAAGGASKNRMARETVHLPAGRYVVAYATDGSHSYPRFNAAPPFDPMAWGIVIRAKTAGVLAATFEPGDSLGTNVIVALAEVGNREYRQQGFTLARAATVRVVAVGEGDDDEMADCGWITNAGTRKKVWEMRYRDTEHAGGARKNRIADERVTLEAGSYVVHYVCDGSHAFGSWNAAPPHEPHRWGITVVAVGDGFDPADVKPYVEESEPGVLARIERVGDDAHRLAAFRLAEDAEVEILALGEGSGGRMVDLAWIEDESNGRIVWEMTYRETEHAGGAQKNRLFEGTVTLLAGSYTLHYESDGSHSWDDWNAAPPRDPESWGATVRLAKRLPAEAEPGRP